MDQQVVVESTTLLEREHELERVRDALRAVGQRAGGVLAIEGPPGIGKSRLLIEARARGEQRGLRILTARATELEQGYPFGVVRQLFERALVEAEPGVSRALAVGRRGACGRRARRRAGRRCAVGVGRPRYGRPRLCVAARPVLACVEYLERRAPGAAGRRPSVVRRAIGAGAHIHRAPAGRPATVSDPGHAPIRSDPGARGGGAADRSRYRVASPAAAHARVSRRIDPGPSGPRAARPLRRRMHRRDRRQPVPDRRAARRGRRSGHRPEHSRRCRRARHDRPARSREHGPAAAGANRSARRRAGTSAQRARRRRPGRRRREAGSDRRLRSGGGDGVARLRRRDRVRGRRPLHASDPAHGDLRGPVCGRT